jgi:hypothetical protein
VIFVEWALQNDLTTVQQNYHFLFHLLDSVFFLIWRRRELVPQRGWYVSAKLYNKTAKILTLNLISYNRPNFKVGNTNFTQGILRLVVTGNVNAYRLDDKKDKCG